MLPSSQPSLGHNPPSPHAAKPLGSACRPGKLREGNPPVPCFTSLPGLAPAKDSSASSWSVSRYWVALRECSRANLKRTLDKAPAVVYSSLANL